MKTPLGGLPFRSLATPLLHALRVRRGVAKEILKFFALARADNVRNGKVNHFKKSSERDAATLSIPLLLPIYDFKWIAPTRYDC
jgi:hypothetical protein